ncbi:2'-5' RNA ligase family protein [Nonomuraea sp. NPDC049607]|uniref:2'-5' RNA ligase family protein n=1 Tax=Nonomuraea sp. NPDC049607 TaxID=3154732 RepID=UPI0034417A28
MNHAPHGTDHVPSRRNGARPGFDVRFAGCGRFPGVLYPAPGPERPFRELTEAVAARWPEAPPYEGRFASIVPHLTVADRQEPELLDHVEAELAAGLPLTARVREVRLPVGDGRRRREERAFPLGEIRH